MVLANGAGRTSLDDIRTGTRTSKSQLFHYFPGGKRDLVSAIAAYQSRRVLDAQRPALDTLDTWAAWDAWRAAVRAHYAGQPHLACPIGSLAAETAAGDPELAAELREHMNRWRGFLEAGVARMREAGHLRPEADSHAVGLAVFSALQGGLLLMQTENSLEPLDAGLDGALTILRAWATG